MTLDIDSIRKEFPILGRTLPNGKQLVYFDNAATSQKPLCVIEAMSRYYSEYNSNAHRANHTLADGTKPKPQGYATYALTVKLPDKTLNISLRKKFFSIQNLKTLNASFKDK